MWSDRLTARLRRLYGAAPVPGDMSTPPPALEAELLARHAELYPPAAARRSPYRWAVAGVAAAIGVVAACRVPVDYERAFGASVACELSRETWPEGQLEELASGLARDLAASGAAIRVSDHGGATRTFRIDLWGADDDDLSAALAGRAPGLPADACTRIPLHGTVHGTLGGRLGYGLLDLDLDHADAEQARLQILAELERQGLDGAAQVQIHDDGAGSRKVEIRIEAYRPDGGGEPGPPLPPLAPRR